MLQNCKVIVYDYEDTILNHIYCCCHDDSIDDISNFISSGIKMNKDYMPEHIYICGIKYSNIHFHDYIKILWLKLYEQNKAQFNALISLKQSFKKIYVQTFDGHDKVRAGFEAVHLKGPDVIKQEVNSFAKMLATNYKTFKNTGALKNYVDIKKSLQLSQTLANTMNNFNNNNNSGNNTSNNNTVNPSITNNRALPLSLAGLNVCITGTLSLKRRDIEEIITNAGGFFQNSITNGTNLLVVGEKPGSTKIETAKKRGVLMVNESQFNSMI